MTSTSACSSERISDCAPVKLIGAAFSSGCGCESLLRRPLRIARTARRVSLVTDLVGVSGQLEGGPLEGFFGRVTAPRGHLCAVDRTTHDRVLGLEVAREPALLLRV